MCFILPHKNLKKMNEEPAEESEDKINYDEFEIDEFEVDEDDGKTTA